MARNCNCYFSFWDIFRPFTSLQPPPPQKKKKTKKKPKKQNSNSIKKHLDISPGVKNMIR